MSGRGGRDRFRRDHPQRSEERRSSAPPSRHLWVGNLSHSVTLNTLTNQFIRFGELENIAFQPGRSYAFVNFIKEEEAISALRALQGFVVAGNPLKIEFTKAEKSSVPSREGDYFQFQDEERHAVKGSQKDPRERYHASSEPFYPGDKSAEPSDVLWIGFPASLKLDEVTLRKAFSPFGEITKITAFPGRSYAFVQFRNVLSACRAKETLQGKLFGNPRVHICFAKGERSPMNIPSLRSDRNFGGFGDPAIRPLGVTSDFETGNPDGVGFGKTAPLWTGETFEKRRWQEFRPQVGVSEDIHESRPYDFSTPPKGLRYAEDPWDLPEEDGFLFHGAKKQKTDPYPLDTELPEYPFSDSATVKKQNTFLPVGSEFGQPGHPLNSGLQRLHSKMNTDHWNTSQDNRYQEVAGSKTSNHIEWNRLTPEPHQSPSNRVWKWEGTIAKGGTAVCRARCFPVGKVLDFMLPEFLDCTARTGLDMLAKHYYQAAAAWVVFFVPESDADIGFYNEFMHYLGEKQRAAVAKLDEKTTLFLVPPSDFSEKVLKVPGKLSISGVILRLEQPNFNSGSFNQSTLEKKDNNNFISYHGDTSYPRPASPSRLFPPLASLPYLGKGGTNNQTLSASYSNQTENGHEYNPLHQRASAPNWSAHHLQMSATRNLPQDTAADHQRQETSFSHYYPSGIVPASGISMRPTPELQPEQLAQLASSLLGQERQPSGVTPTLSTGEEFKHSSIRDQSGNNQLNALQSFDAFRINQHPITSGFDLQQTSDVSALPHHQTEFQGNQQLHSAAGTQDEGEADPQKRLQATLQLAAALLQQIQQGKGT